MNKLLSSGYLASLVCVAAFVASCGSDHSQEPLISTTKSQAAHSSSASSTPQYDSLSDELDAFLTNQVSASAPGIALLIMQNGEVVYHAHRGLANSSANILISNRTGFRTASISKSFTALATMQLVEAGQLHLTDSVRAYLPELAATWQNIRIEHLLSHRSGVPDVLTPFSLMHNLSHDDAVEYYANHPKLNFEPDSRISYSNTNYVLLAEIVERVSGYSFTDYMRTNIFDVAGMGDSYFADENTPLRSQDALNFARTSTLYNGITAYLVGNMGQVSSTEDFMGFFNAMRAHQIVSETTLALMTTPRGELFGGHYGYGFMLYPGSLGHGGLLDGFRTEMTLNTELDLQYVMLTNGGNRTQDYINQIRSIIYSWAPLNNLNNINAPGA